MLEVNKVSILIMSNQVKDSRTNLKDNKAVVEVNHLHLLLIRNRRMPLVLINNNNSSSSNLKHPMRMRVSQYREVSPDQKKNRRWEEVYDRNQVQRKRNITVEIGTVITMLQHRFKVLQSKSILIYLFNNRIRSNKRILESIKMNYLHN